MVRATGLLAIAALIAAAAAPVAGVKRERQARDPVAAALARFDAVDLDGRRWTAADLDGRVILLDFWATWCAPCLADLPRLRATYEKHGRSDFEILGISLDAAARPSFVSWLNRHRIDWPQVHERAAYSGRVARLFGIDSLPRTVLIDEDGTIAAVDLRGAQLVAAVDRLVSARIARRVDTRELSRGSAVRQR